MMVKIFSTAFIFLFSIFAIPHLAVPAENAEEAKPLIEKEQKKITSDREKKAYEIFNEILTLTETTDTKTVLPQIEALYLRIIKEYPDTALAQESYWRLVLLYVDKYTPPKYEKAEDLYSEFLKKYPGSVIRNLIEDTLSKSYYKNEKWDRLSKLYSYVVKEFGEKGKLSNPNPMFMYAEAKFNLGDLAEAGKAYKIVIEQFPTSGRATTAKARLEDIKNRKGKADVPPVK